MYVWYLLKRFVFLSLFLLTMCIVCILSVLLMVLLVSGVYVCVHAKETNITGKCLTGQLNSRVYERTGHGQFHLCKVNKFFLFHQGDLAHFYLFLFSFKGSNKKGLMLLHQIGGLQRNEGEGGIHLYKKMHSMKLTCKY